MNNYEIYEFKILVNKNELVVKDKLIAILSPKIHGTGLIKVYSTINSEIEKIFIDETRDLKPDEKLFYLKPINIDFEKKLFEQNKNKLTQSEVNGLKDDFTGNYKISLSNIAGSKFDYLNLYSVDGNFKEYLGVSFFSSSSNSYIGFQSFSDTFSLAKGDEIIMLFDNNYKLNIVFSSGLSGSKCNYYNLEHIPLKDIEVISENNLNKLKIISNRKKTYQVYTFNNFANNKQYESELEGQWILKDITKKFIQFYIDNRNL